MKRWTSKKLTIEILHGHFLGQGPEGWKIDVDSLNWNIKLLIDNYEPLYTAVTKTKRKATAIAWEAFQKVIADRVNLEHCGEKDASEFYATSEQMKEFLNTYGDGYKTIADSVRYVEEMRKEAREWREWERRRIEEACGEENSGRMEE